MPCVVPLESRPLGVQRSRLSIERRYRSDDRLIVRIRAIAGASSIEAGRMMTRSSLIPELMGTRAKAVRLEPSALSEALGL